MKAFLDYLVDSIVDIVLALFGDLLELLKDLFFLIFDQLLDLMIFLMKTLLKDKMPDVDLKSQWAGVPMDVLQILDYVDFVTCIGLVVTAMGIRLVMLFIPFVK